MQTVLAQNVIPLFGYCIRGCGRPAVRTEARKDGYLSCLCGDEATCQQESRKYMPAYCDPANEVRGARYDRNLDVKEIAKRMRQAIKAELPGVKVSVRIDRYSGGQSIYIELKDGPFDVAPIIPRNVWYEEQDRAGVRRSWKENHDPAMAEAMDKLKEIHGRWNRDNSDSMSDYFDVNYYGGVRGPDGTSW